MQLVKWIDLSSIQKSEVKRAFVHWVYDPSSTGFEDWAASHAFYIRKDGRLSRKHNHCKPAYLAD